MSAQIVKKRITISVLAQLASQLLLGVFGVVVLKIMTSSLGIQKYGIYATAYSFVSTFSLLTDLGLQSITTREIAKHPEDANEIIGYNMGLRLLLCVIMVPTISILGFILYPHASNDLRLGILLLSSYLFLDAVQTVSLTYFGAKVRNDVPAAITTAQQFIFLLLVLGAANIGWGLFGFVEAYLLASGIGAITAIFIARKRVSVRPRIQLESWRKIIGMSIALGIISIINMIYLKVDSIMLSVLKGTTAVGIYGVAYSLINVFVYFGGYVMQALTPSIATAKEDELGEIVQKAFHFMVTFSFFLPVVCLVISHNVVLVVSSNAFAPAAVPFSILALATTFTYLIQVLSFTSVAINKHHKMVYVSITSLLLNVGVNLWLIPRYGITGAAWATVLSELFALLVTYFIFYKETHIAINLGVALKPFFASILVYGSSLALHSLWSTDNLLFNTFVSGMTLSAIYFLILYAVKGLPAEINDILQKRVQLPL